jgi:hypothetical protein
MQHIALRPGAKGSNDSKDDIFNQEARQWGRE